MLIFTPRQRLWRMAMAAAACITLIAGITFALLRVDDRSFIAVATPVGGAMTLKLSDGTTVYLSTDTRLSYALGPTLRSVSLEQGEAYFEVAHDAARPFVVTSGAHAITVAGTAFDVKFVDHVTLLTVTEGITRVSHTSANILANRQTKDIQAGMSARMTKDGGVNVSSARGLDAVGAWRTGRLIYRDRPIAEIIADLDRYVGSELLLANTARSGDLFTLVMQVDGEPAMLKRMQQLLPITLRESYPGIYEIRVK